jgi:hypothetical protein
VHDIVSEVHAEPRDGRALELLLARAAAVRLVRPSRIAILLALLEPAAIDGQDHLAQRSRTRRTPGLLGPFGDPALKACLAITLG